MTFQEMKRYQLEKPEKIVGGSGDNKPPMPPDKN